MRLSRNKKPADSAASAAAQNLSELDALTASLLGSTAQKLASAR